MIFSVFSEQFLLRIEHKSDFYLSLLNVQMHFLLHILTYCFISSVHKLILREVEGCLKLSQKEFTVQSGLVGFLNPQPPTSL